MVVDGDALYLYGGHSVAVEADKTEIETVYDDMWRLDLKSYQVYPCSHRKECGSSSHYAHIYIFPSELAEHCHAQCVL